MQPPTPHSTNLEALLGDGAWMRRLAAALVGRDGDDLVQDTWLAVLRRRPRGLERPRAWLATVMKNAARMRARGGGRLREREALAARPPDAEPSAVDLAARAELLQLAMAAILAVAEPYRETLLLRYVRGLEPAEIAGRSGLLAPGTYVFRTRCQRFAAPDRTVEIVAGATSEIEIPLEPAAHRTIRCRPPEGEPWACVRVTVRDAAGGIAYDHEASRQPASEWATFGVAGLPPGTYAVAARSDTGHAATAALVVALPGREDEILVLDLR